MSFLGGGAECSTAGNPLSQFTKHTQDDKSLQRDRLMGRTQGGMQGMRNSGIPGSQDNMMNEFLQQGGQMPQNPAEAFAFEQMMQEQMRQSPQMRHNPQSPSSWAREFTPGLDDRGIQGPFQAPKGPGFNPADFARFQQINQQGPVQTTNPTQVRNGFQQPVMGYSISNMGMMGGAGYMPMFQQQQNMSTFQNGQEQQHGKGKGKMIELDDENWEAEFAQIDLEGKEEDESLAMEGELNQMDRSVVENHESETNYGDFESIWRGIQAEKAAARDINDEGLMDDPEFMRDFEQFEGFDGLGTHGAFRDPQLGDYMFEEENIFKDVNNPFEEGQRIMTEGGNLSLAALAFEAAVQKDTSHIDAWVALGSAQAQNEKETPAIRALEHALKLDPNRLEALMGLAVSYTNEGYDSTAYRTLERWLSVKYPSIVAPSALSPETELGFTDRHQLHAKVTELFISAAQLAPDGEHMDPDVQVGLGVLFYGAEEYAKAVDCFSTALASREGGTSTREGEVHLLWNRLGATLANSGRSEEAIAAYEKALTLNANFVRARYNLGVSCINLGCYAEAAGHLLGALAMHRVVQQEGREKARELVGGGAGGGAAGADADAQIDMMINQNQSTNLYDTLRRVFSQMGRRDLAERVVNGMDVESFRDEFQF